MPAPNGPYSKRSNEAALEAAKQIAAKSAAAAIVITMATDVGNSDFAAASKKAYDLAKRYGELSLNRLP